MYFQRLSHFARSGGYREGCHWFPRALQTVTASAAVLLGLGLTACSVPQATYPHRLFESLTEAVLAATNRYNPISIREDREFMGTIYQHGDQFGYTVASGRPGAGASEIYISRAYLEDVVAFWHTHGEPAAEFQYFSNADTALVNQFGIPLYLADFTGELKVFLPGDETLSAPAALQLLSVNDDGFATGRVVKDADNRVIRVNTQTPGW